MDSQAPPPPQGILPGRFMKLLVLLLGMLVLVPLLEQFFHLLVIQVAWLVGMHASMNFK
jgi:hypothetical protein